MSAALKEYEVTETEQELSELVYRVQQGEEFLLTKGGNPVASLIRQTDPHERQARLAREILTDKEIEQLTQAMETPLSTRDQRILEGEGTNEVGIWIGLQEADQRIPEPDIPDHIGTVLGARCKSRPWQASQVTRRIAVCYNR